MSIRPDAIAGRPAAGDGERARRLAEALDSIRLGEAVYLRAHLDPPWAFRIPARPTASFHVLTRGACSVIVGRRRIELGPGDVVLLPHGDPHDLVRRGRAPREVAPVDALDWRPLTTYAAVLHDDRRGTAETTMICGKIAPEPADHPLWSSLPTALHAPAEGAAEGLVVSSLRSMALEVDQPGLGSAAIVRRLAGLIVLGVVRAWLRSAAPDTGWLAGLMDERIGPVLAALQTHPEEAWTLEAMSRRARMSRSRFAARFTAVVGETPARTVLTCRIRRAGALLREGSSVAEAAWAAGYRSEASFSRAYKRLLGVSPGRAGASRPGENPE